jgi:hypothetical protein
MLAGWSKKSKPSRRSGSASGPDAFRRYRAQEKLSRWEVTLNILRHGHVANVHVADAFQASMPVIS